MVKIKSIPLSFDNQVHQPRVKTTNNFVIILKEIQFSTSRIRRYLNFNAWPRLYIVDSVCQTSDLTCGSFSKNRLKQDYYLSSILVNSVRTVEMVA